MKIAYLHVLPLEYYPPATNALSILSRHPGWRVRAWSSANARNLTQWRDDAVRVSRPFHPHSASRLPFRAGGYMAWHLRTAAEIAAWKPDALISVEPHSALAAWLYYRVMQGRAALFIHHHEYYAREDFSRGGMRLLRRTMPLERDYLFPRAEWVSQTNEVRLRLLREWNHGIREEAARILPNYPTEEWALRAKALPRPDRGQQLRLVYAGSASFDDTFIREAAEWVAGHPGTMSLHVAGNNVSRDVWDWLESLKLPNITTDRAGFDYDALPGLLRHFDVGLIIYKGNTLNFVHNVPNKAIEYLACGLNVWYPIQMEGMRLFRRRFPAEALTEVDFQKLPLLPPTPTVAGIHDPFPFTAEAALAPLMAELERIERTRASR